MVVSTYDKYYERIENEAISSGLADFRLAREEFHNLTGKFEDGEPWFELRMAMFLDWYLMDRPGPDGNTPVETYLIRHASEMDRQELDQMAYLTVTLRSVFELIESRNDVLNLLDLLGGGHWMAHSTLPTLGLSKGDIFGARIVYWDGRPTIGKGIVLHPIEARQVIKEIIARGLKEEIPTRNLSDYLDKMRLKLDKYSNVRIQHVYRYPGSEIL
ncbi:MAG: hypothetical protein QNJ97_12345 [Myxococcota bacterium]|nr:hypothetical protein [Myxococcota bacterium]